ncbi:uncharacterized protein P884DRAFT_255594 [Thermothelomyces heterothallicus CBS 202.75]|uniref:uncharacterized protein n=1 Tax=Thermothelomyces heterothallicus CBS 202.75 TaxID=1149848 RepID=UPI00374206AA
MMRNPVGFKLQETADPGAANASSGRELNSELRATKDMPRAASRRMKAATRGRAGDDDSGRAVHGVCGGRSR